MSPPVRDEAAYRLPAVQRTVTYDLVDSDDPTRELRLGGIVIFLFFGLFLGWSLIAHLDAAAYGVGQISVAGHRQTVQHKDGGTVSGLFVKEGQHVKAGQVLISLAPSDVQAAERAMASHVIGLQAQRARLLAEQMHSGQVAPPPEFAGLTGPDAADAADALALQRRELAARAHATASQKSVLAQRAAQLREQITGFQAQAASTDQQAKLIQDELAGTKTLAEKGYASTNRLRALERTAAGLSGSRADLVANAARSRAQIGEMSSQALGLDTSRMEDVAKDLRDVENQLNDALPKLAALKTQLAQTQIRAPATGMVVGLQVFSVNGVIAAGEKILDIVPDQAPLVMEVNFAPKDADSVHVGQEAEVRSSALTDRRLPILHGQITRISADSVVDEKSGQRFFTGEVTVPPSELDKVKAVRGPKDGVRAGLPVTVIVPLRKRTAFQYLTEPLTTAFWGSFREH